MTLRTAQLVRDPLCLCLGCLDGEPCVVRPAGVPTSVYRLHSFSGLLYVGCSRYVYERASYQVRIKGWEAGHYPRRVVIEHYATRDEALTAEARAIRDEAPMLNIKQEYPPLHDGWLVVPLGVEVFGVSHHPGLYSPGLSEPVHQLGMSHDEIWESQVYAAERALKLAS